MHRKSLKPYPLLSLLLLGITSLGSLTPTQNVLAAQDKIYLQNQNLEQKAKEALDAGKTKQATQYALQMLKTNTNHRAWYYGNTIDVANQVLGLAALKEGRRAEARNYLIAAGKTPGSPQLNSFGPQMVLAQQLLAKGEKAAVIQYLDLVARFWAHTTEANLQEFEKARPGSGQSLRRMYGENQARIELWKREIRAGRKPTLNMSDSF